MKKIPMRQCIGCGQMKDKRQLVRIVKTPEGAIVLDTTGKQNGRGAYICNERECLQKIQKVRALDRSFKISVSQDTYEALLKEFEKING